MEIREKTGGREEGEVLAKKSFEEIKARAIKRIEYPCGRRREGIF